jgi:hypothetical protein
MNELRNFKMRQRGIAFRQCFQKSLADTSGYDMSIGFWPVHCSEFIVLNFE